MYLHKFFLAWIITVVSETVVLLVLFRKFSKDTTTNAGLVITASIFASSLTLPYVWFVFPYLFLGHYSLSLILSEIFAWLAEAGFYKLSLRLTWKRALAFSLIANVVSYALGYFIGHGLV